MSDVGQADLTAHVDFYALKKAALTHYAQVVGSVEQGEFLKNIGIQTRAKILKKNATVEQKNELYSGLRRLINPSLMGKLFKAISIFSQGLDEPIGFSSPPEASLSFEQSKKLNSP